MRRSHQESLKRLGLDRVDILHIHDCDDDVEAALADAFPALAELRAQGVIRAVSAGVNDAKILVRLAQVATFDCFLAAGTYTLLDQSALAELLPLCERKGISIIAAGVFNGGILASPATGASYSSFPLPPGAMERAAALDEVCRSHAVPLLAAALQFPLGHPAVSCVVIGARSVAELDEDVAALPSPYCGVAVAGPERPRTDRTRRAGPAGGSGNRPGALTEAVPCANAVSANADRNAWCWRPSVAVPGVRDGSLN